MFSIPDGSFKTFESYTVKFSAKETKWTSLGPEHTLVFLRLWFQNKMPGPLTYRVFRETGPRTRKLQKNMEELEEGFLYNEDDVRNLQHDNKKLEHEVNDLKKQLLYMETSSRRENLKSSEYQRIPNAPWKKDHNMEPRLRTLEMLCTNSWKLSLKCT